MTEADLTLRTRLVAARSAWPDELCFSLGALLAFALTFVPSSPRLGRCYCSDAGDFNSKSPASSNQCNMPCPGNPDQLCGGPDALSILYRNGRSA